MEFAEEDATLGQEEEENSELSDDEVGLLQAC